MAKGGFMSTVRGVQPFRAAFLASAAGTDADLGHAGFAPLLRTSQTPCAPQWQRSTE